MPFFNSDSCRSGLRLYYSKEFTSILFYGRTISGLISSGVVILALDGSKFSNFCWLPSYCLTFLLPLYWLRCLSYLSSELLRSLFILFSSPDFSQRFSPLFSWFYSWPTVGSKLYSNPPLFRLFALSFLAEMLYLFLFPLELDSCLGALFRWAGVVAAIFRTRSSSIVVDNIIVLSDNT